MAELPTPELRAAATAELLAAVDAASALTADEAAVLRHAVAHAGCSIDGTFFVPGLSVLWGGRESYIPPVGLPPDRVREACATLRRRGVLAPVEGGVVVDKQVLRDLRPS